MWIELTERRGQKEKHFYDSDTNKFRAVLTIHDQHFKDDFDDWIDVDENFVDDTGSFNKKCDKTRHAVHVGNGGNRRWYPRRNVQTEYVDILGIQYWTGSQWRNINLPMPVWRNNISEWDMTNLYASITNTWKRVKSEFILKNSNAYTRLRFQVSFTGLIYDSATGELTSTTDGLVWGSIDAPTAKDANNVRVPVTATYDGTYIEWSVNTTGATFPIDVDPTFTDGDGGDTQTYNDTMLFSDNATTNYATYTEMWIHVSTAITPSYGLIKFNLSSIPAGVTYTSITLTLVTSTSYAEGDQTLSVYRILPANNGWTEDGATWAHAVENTVEWAGSVGCGTAGTDYSNTAMGSHGRTNPDSAGTSHDIALGDTEFENMRSSNSGLLLRLSYSAENYYDFWKVGTSDHATTGYRPKLVVEYEGGGCVNVVVQTTVVVDWCEP